MTYVPIVPAVIPSSLDEIIKYAENLSFSPEFHLDLVDGKFVPTISWPYEPIDDILSVKPYLDFFTPRLI